MRVEVTRCDNPTCHEITDDMYGWVIAPELAVLGTGPTVRVEVCSVDCLSDGAKAVLARYHYEVHEKEYLQQQRTKHTILSVICPTCKAAPSSPCVTETSKTKPGVHAARREAGYALLRAEKEDNPQ